MYGKALILFAIIAAVNAGVTPAVTYVHDSPHLGAQSEHTVRGFAGLSSVSKQAKAVDSAFSSVRTNDVRVTNNAAYAAFAPAAYAAPAPVAYAAPAPVAYAAPAPVVKTAVAAAPVHYAHHTYSAVPAVAHTYAAPAPIVKSYAAPAPVATYAAAPAIAKVHAPAVATYAAPAYATYAAPAVAKVHAPAVATYAAPAVAKVHQPLLGVAYSAVSPAVATLSFNGYGIHYGY